MGRLGPLAFAHRRPKKGYLRRAPVAPARANRCLVATISYADTGNFGNVFGVYGNNWMLYVPTEGPAAVSCILSRTVLCVAR